MVPVSFKKSKTPRLRERPSRVQGGRLCSSPSGKTKLWPKSLRRLWTSLVMFLGLWSQTKENNLCKDTFLPNEWCMRLSISARDREKEKKHFFLRKQGNRERRSGNKNERCVSSCLAALRSYKSSQSLMR